MDKVILVTGGCRSGKSNYARNLGESLGAERVLVATCPVTDDEMRRRIEIHQQARRDRGWRTVEEETDLVAAIEQNGDADVLLIDCVTLWVNNLMFHDDDITETDVAARCDEVLRASRNVNATVIFVTNEVGSGIVPENELARRYRDRVGRANQTLAAGADAVTLLVSGVPLRVKGADTA